MYASSRKQLHQRPNCNHTGPYDKVLVILVATHYQFAGHRVLECQDPRSLQARDENRLSQAVRSSDLGAQVFSRTPLLCPTGPLPFNAL